MLDKEFDLRRIVENGSVRIVIDLNNLEDLIDKPDHILMK